MALFLARDPESRGDLIAWWEGERLEAQTQVVCEANEVVVFVDDDEVVATLGPGRHSLEPPPPPLERYLKGSLLAGPDEIAVGFVTTSPTRLDAAGVLEDLDSDGEDVEPRVTFGVALCITDAAKVLPLLEKLGEEESLEDWLVDELLLHAQAAAWESNKSVSELTSGAHAAELGEQTAQRAREVLADYGIDVQRIDQFAIVLDDESD